VGFRYCACREADRLGITGWVRNTDEGDVEVHAEGPPEALEAFTRWLHSGPPGARVESVHLQPSTPYNCYTAFSVEF
jgi:acylphosphatase